MRGTLMSINYFRQYELRNRDIVTLAPTHEVNGISIKAYLQQRELFLEGPIKSDPGEIDLFQLNHFLLRKSKRWIPASAGITEGKWPFPGHQEI